MKTTFIACSLLVASAGLVAAGTLPPEPRTQFDISKDSGDMAWWRESMETRDERLAWWRDARFGMFIHWNATAVLGGEWKGEVYRGYAEHIQRQAKIPCNMYRDEVVGQFRPTEFDADRWIRALKHAGMRYLVINSRVCQWTPHGYYGDYQSTVDRPADFYPVSGDWEGIPTTNESYGWHRHDLSHKPVSFFIRLIAKAAARGGNLMLNIGPMGDGRMDPKDVAILKGIGQWMSANESSIRGTERTPLPVQAWGESTARGNLVFLHVFDWPRDRELVLGGLKSPVKKAWLLSDPEQNELPFRRAGKLDVSIGVPTESPDSANSVVVIETEGAVEANPVRLLSAKRHANLLRGFDSKLNGKGLRYGTGKSYDNYVHGWTKTDQSVVWDARLTEPAHFEVSIEYSTQKKDKPGRFEVRLGETTVQRTVKITGEGPREFARYSLGTVRLPAGPCRVEVRPLELPGRELMRLRALHLVQVQDEGVGKTGTERLVPLNPRALALVEDILGERGSRRPVP